MNRFITLSRSLLTIGALVVCSGAFLSGHGHLSGPALGPGSTLPSAATKSANDNCQDELLAAPSSAPLSRLSKSEYTRTLWDLLGAEVANSLPALAGLIAGVPDDDMQSGFANITWSLSADHVSGYLGVANEVGVQIVSQSRLRRKLLPCAADLKLANKACIQTILNTFATRAYRRPLTPQEKATLVGFHASQAPRGSRAALQALITRVLMSPPFLFKQGAVPPPEERTCDQLRKDRSYERASRLAFGLWGTMPDAALFTAAGAGGLLDDGQLASELTRMSGNAKAREWFRIFFRQWLHYEHRPVEGYSAPFLGSVDRAHLHDNAGEELDRFIDAIVWTDAGNYRDLLTSRKVMTVSPAIRQIYGLPKAPPSESEQLADDHAGILTRVAMLAQGGDDASVVKRGAFIRRQILCDPLSPPDPSQLPPGSLVPPAKDHRMTTRQRWEARTSPVICQGCHRMINPLGFLLEAYDGVGRFRTVERQPIPDTAPQAYNEFAIDTVAVPFIEGRSEAAIDGPVALSEFIGNSRKANACFVKQLNTFVSGRVADATDAAALEGLTDELMRPGGSIKDVLLGVVKRHVQKH
jgi:hypothetical protein